LSIGHSATVNKVNAFEVYLHKAWTRATEWKTNEQPQNLPWNNEPTTTRSARNCCVSL